MVKQSAGLLLFRRRDAAVEVFLVHPDGPFWNKKDNGAWSIPKGEFANGEDPLEAARREFLEETGYSVDGKFTALKPVKQRGGKVVHAWLVEADVDAANVTSNTFLMEWPRSGQIQTFPEVDRAAWFSFEEAREKILESQLPLLDEAQSLVTQRSV
jgi:predicted NUDIX family NTP pyrophosphohydrolase